MDVCFYYFMCMDVLSACVSVYYMCAAPKEARKAVRSFGTGITGGYELPCEYWVLNLCLLDEQPVLVTAGLSFQAQILHI